MCGYGYIRSPIGELRGGVWSARPLGTRRHQTESIGVLLREERGVLFTADTELRETEPEAERAP